MIGGAGLDDPAGGVITQQLANALKEAFAEGSFSTLLPQLAAMYQAHYAP